ncbi:MAG: GHKL domain-containing protein [Clostridia bacterium]|nr:GHKL domain-containing protein [Clostridia bacterium]
MTYIWVIASVLAVMAADLLFFLLFLPRILSRRMERFQSEQMQRHVDEVETMYRRTRAWHHDMRNHLQTMKAYMELREYDRAEDYLESLAQDLQGVDTLVKTGNVSVDAIIGSKLNLMRERGIRVDATAYLPEELPFSALDLCILLGNLLDNAMEACVQVNEEDRFVRLYMDVIRSQFYLCVSNSMQGTAQRQGGRYVSRKSGEHGFGILRIDQMVKQHRGLVNRQSEEGVFATEITLPLI